MQHYTRGQPLSQIRNLHGKDEVAPDLNMWSWGPMKYHMQAPPTNKGYKGIPRTVGTIVQASLMSQLYDFDLVMAKNEAGKAMMWAKEEDIERAAACPVLLCHTLDYKPEQDHVHLLSPLPVPWHGSYAFVAQDKQLVLYFIKDLPEAAREKYQQARKKIIDLADRAKPDDIDHMWVASTPMHQSVADETTFQTFKQKTVSNILSTSNPQKQAEYDQQLNMIMLYRSQILMIDRLLLLPDYQDRFQEIACMMQELAQAYLDHHHSQITTQAQAKKDPPPVHDGMTEKGLLMPYCMPLYAVTEAIQNAASGAGRWEGDTKQPPFYARPSGEHNMNTIEYGRESEQQIFEEKAVINLWKEVKTYKDSDIDLLLYTISAIIKETNGEGAAWIWASKFLDDRDIKPITKTEGSVTRRAGHRSERLAEIDEAIYRLSGLWITIHEVTPPRKGAKRARVYTHRGRLWAVMETWTQKTLIETTGEIEEKLPVAWKIKTGDWLMEYLGPARRYVGYLCDQALKYDPYHQQDEKRLAYYFLFFMRFNAKNNNTFLVREIGELLKACTLQPNERDPQRAKSRFEKAMNQITEDGIVDSWEYVPESMIELPSKKWLPTWLQWKVKVFVRARLEPPK